MDTKRLIIFVIGMILISSCNIKIIPHNLHKSPKVKERGWVDTPSGVKVHKDTLTKEQYERYKEKH